MAARWWFICQRQREFNTAFGVLIDAAAFVVFGFLCGFEQAEDLPKFGDEEEQHHKNTTCDALD